MYQLSSSLTIALAVLLAFQLLSRVRRRWLHYRFAASNHCQPAVHFPHRDPFLGLDFFFQLMKSTKQSRRMETTMGLYGTYGRTWQSTSFGREIVNTIDPLNIQSVMAHNFDSWGLEPMRYPAAAPFMGRGVFTSDGPFWQHARAQVKPILSKAQFSDLGRLEFHFQNFLALIPRNGDAVDVLPLLERLSTDIVTEFLLGESVGTLTGDSSTNHQEFLSAFANAAIGVGRRIMLGKLGAFFPDKKFDNACRITHAYVDQRIDEAFADLNVQDDSSTEKNAHLMFLRELAEETKDRILIRDQVLNVLNAANDGAAIVISHIIFLLSRYSKVQDKLQKEVLATAGSDKPTYEMLKNMTYLRYVINETLRLYPLVPTNSRIALKDTLLPTGGGSTGKAPIFVEKGSVYSTNSYVLHRDKGIWGEDAEEFKPERWKTHRQGWEYQAFGGGARTCPGQGLVLTEIAYMVARMLQELGRIESRDEKPWKECLKLTMSNANGVVVGFVH